MMHACLAECLARDAGGVLADTRAYAVWCRRHGFRRPAEGELEASRQGQWWIYRPDDRSPFRLLDDDF